MASKKMQAKGRAILKAKSSIHPPTFIPEEYKLSMMRSLNYYSANVEDKDKRKFAIKYWKDQGKNVGPLSSLADSWFSTIGAVAHMIQSGVQIHEHDLIRLDSAYNQLLKEVKPEPTIVETKNVEQKKSIQDYMNEAASLHIGELEGMLDDLCRTGEYFDAKGYLTKQQIKAPVAKRIADWFKPKLQEFKLAIDDKELLEGYSNLGKRGLNKLVSQVEGIINDCNTMAQIAKTTRAPRKRKEKPPSVLVAKMKWLREFVELKLKSIHAEKIVGADMIMMYDTVKRRIIKYQALDGYTLSVKGTAIQNFDPEKSGSKIIRKPEIQLKGCQEMTKRPINNLFNEIKATSGRLNGRTNDNLIIIGVYQ